MKISQERDDRRDQLMSLENDLATHGRRKIMQVNKERHTVKWSGRRESLILLLMSIQSLEYNHLIPLSHWSLY